jgi:hypothetical protein
MALTLTTLKSRLTSAISGIFTQIFFDYAEVLNTSIAKTYTYVAWNFDTASGKVSLREAGKELEMEVIAVNTFNPETDDLLAAYDSLEAKLLSYMTAVGLQTNIQVLTDIADIEYYPRGTVSIDSEIGVKIKVTLKLWC